MKKYWLFKSEPSGFSIDDLNRLPGKTTHWDGVRNYQARNSLRDDVAKGDGVLFYHSKIETPQVVGACIVVRSGYPDHTAFDPAEKHFDVKSDPSRPRWFMVDLKLKRIFRQPVELSTLKSSPGLEEMVVTQKGSRLSIQPVTEREWRIVHGLAGEEP
ncbi:MAG: EVE domain-containing protein [Candidatus Zixiibacteriota bacterium]